jgi:hypothetical protein
MYQEVFILNKFHGSLKILLIQETLYLQDLVCLRIIFAFVNLGRTIHCVLANKDV